MFRYKAAGKTGIPLFSLSWLYAETDSGSHFVTRDHVTISQLTYDPRDP